MTELSLAIFIKASVVKARSSVGEKIKERSMAIRRFILGKLGENRFWRRIYKKEENGGMGYCVSGKSFTQEYD